MWLKIDAIEEKPIYEDVYHQKTNMLKRLISNEIIIRIGTTKATIKISGDEKLIIINDSDFNDRFDYSEHARAIYNLGYNDAVRDLSKKEACGDSGED